VLGETSEGDPWTLVRYAGLGRRTGWVPAATLGPRRHTDRQVVIDRARMRLRVLDGGEVVFGTRAAVGGPGSPTPAGRTYLRERVVPADRGGAYGVLAFGLGSYSPTRTDWPGGGQVGIHGTNQPGLIPGRISNGCVRLTNGAIRRLDRLTGVGTPVLVL
jgi:lipoprotein-anchoring transpeptidase ErfK/SrfK